jgi:hypothetical protein
MAAMAMVQTQNVKNMDGRFPTKKVILSTFLKTLDILEELP